MSRYIDFNLIGEFIDSHGNVHYEDLQNLPTADAEEIIKEYCEKRCLAVVDGSFLKFLVDHQKVMCNWIPYPEIIPNKIGTYLVASKNSNIYLARWEGAHWSSNGKIIAWMPLPKPYIKKEVQDK